MSTSLKTKGLVSQTSDRTERADRQRPQCSLVKRVILHDWSSLLAARIFVVVSIAKVSTPTKYVIRRQ